MEKDWLTAREAAALLDMSRDTLQYYIQTGKLVAANRAPGRRGTTEPYYFDRARIEEFKRIRPPRGYRFTPTEIECAYLAGFVDGEGCIHIGVARRRGYKSYDLRLDVVNTHLDTLVWIKSRFGGSLYPMTHRVPGHRICYIIRFSGSTAYHVLCLITPFLRVKREEALVGIDFQEHIAANPSRRDRPLTEERARIRDSFRDRLSALKGRSRTG